VSAVAGWRAVDELFHRFTGMLGNKGSYTPADTGNTPVPQSRARELPGLTELAESVSADLVAYANHAQQKIWIADYAAERLRRISLGRVSDSDYVEWGRTIAMNAYVFANVLELASALDNLAFVANKVRSIGVPEQRVDFPLLTRDPAPSLEAVTKSRLAAWQAEPEGQAAMDFRSDPWIDYFYEVRNRLTHHAVPREYTLALGAGELGFVLPAPGALGVAGGGPEAADALITFGELVASFADSFGSSLAQ
jgi:hypothetical protein